MKHTESIQIYRIYTNIEQMTILQSQAVKSWETPHVQMSALPYFVSLFIVLKKTLNSITQDEIAEEKPRCSDAFATV